MTTSKRPGNIRSRSPLVPRAHSPGGGEVSVKVCTWFGPTQCSCVVDSLAGISPLFKFAIHAMVIIVVHADKSRGDFIDEEIACFALTESQFNRFYRSGLDSVALQMGAVSRSIHLEDDYKKANPSRRAKMLRIQKSQEGKDACAKLWAGLTLMEVARMSFNHANFESSLQDYTLSEQLDFEFFTERLATELIECCGDFGWGIVGRPPSELLERISGVCKKWKAGGG